MPKAKRANITEEEINKIVKLLRETDMTVEDISKRFKCHSTVVSQINRRFNARPIYYPKVDTSSEKKPKKRNWKVPPRIKGSFL